jgi:catechol 2,3-dioxygenase-like lactoylglutathione lyase family enzyme
VRRSSTNAGYAAAEAGHVLARLCVEEVVLVTVELNHTIVHATDPERSARFIADILGVPAQPRWGPFIPVVVDHGMALDYMHDAGPFTVQHYAFLVSDDVFDAAFGRITEAGLSIWADPHQQEPGEINHHDAGRGFYFEDPDGHLMELITVPYGGGDLGT